MAFAALVSRGGRVVAYDAFRDMAYTHGILRGELGRDPTLPGLPAWYPPGYPLVFAAVARVTGAPVVTVFGTSLYWLSWLNPVALYLLARRSLGRANAWWSLAFVGLGSMWWLMHAAVPVPSTQGVSLGLLTWLAWLAAKDRPWPAAAMTGVVGAAAMVVHPLCGGLAITGILIHGALAPVLTASEPGRGAAARSVLSRSLLATIVCVALAIPLVGPALSGPVLNDAPRHWFSPALHDPRYALQSHVPLVPIFGIFGLGLLSRDWLNHGWLVAAAGVALLGQLVGYAAHDLGWKVPYLIPHEFQWHFQLLLGIAAVVGWRRVIQLMHRVPRIRAVPPGAISGILLLAALGPALRYRSEAEAFPMRLDASWAGLLRLGDWISERTPPGAIIAADPTYAYYLAGLTGRRAQLVPEGHLNPRVDPAPRIEVLSTLMQTGDPAVFEAARERLPVNYVLHVPTTSAQLAALHERYRGWSIVEEIPLPETTLVFLHVRGRMLAP